MRQARKLNQTKEKLTILHPTNVPDRAGKTPGSDSDTFLGLSCQRPGDSENEFVTVAVFVVKVDLLSTVQEKATDSEPTTRSVTERVGKSGEFPVKENSRTPSVDVISSNLILIRGATNLPQSYVAKIPVGNFQSGICIRAGNELENKGLSANFSSLMEAKDNPLDSQ